MRTKKNLEWYVFIEDINRSCIESYNIFNNLNVDACYEEAKKNRRKKTPEEIAERFKKVLQYSFWSKCEYEIIVYGLFSKQSEIKIDVYDQLKLNMDKLVDYFLRAVYGGDYEQYRSTKKSV